MSWLGKENARLNLTDPHYGPRVSVDFETNWLRKTIHLNLYMRPGEEDMDGERLGRRIDNCLVEFIAFLLVSLREEKLPIEAVKEIMEKVEVGMREDPALQAYAVTLMRDRELPLSSEIYLDLARRHALYGGIPAPTPDEGLRFVSVILARVMKKENWKLNLDIHNRGDGQEYGRLLSIFSLPRHCPLLHPRLRSEPDQMGCPHVDL